MSSQHAGRQRPEVINETQMANITLFPDRGDFSLGPFHRKVKDGYRVAEKEQYDDFSHLRKASAAGLIQKGRTPVLRKKILAYWGEVKELKADGMGFRPIAHYLNQNRKIKTSPTYLAKLWKDVEADD